jgi:2OG-Fe dioxygenase
MSASDVWAKLSERGYALTDDGAIGLPEKFRENFAQAYFNPHTLRHDPGDLPVDRERARDVIHYKWHGDQLELTEHDTIVITDRAGIPGKREHARVRLLADPEAGALVQALLGLIPPDRRNPEGTFSVNLFRTYTNVVTSPHKDNEEFIFVYLLNRVGTGAETRLYPDDAGLDQASAREPVVTHRLEPGEILVFEDARFDHDTSPLVPAPDEQARRDALICTVDYLSTYRVA